MSREHTRKFPELYDREWITDHYVTQGLSSVQVAEMLGCAPSLVQQRLQAFSIKARGRWSGRWNPKTCERCRETYTPSGPAQRFCTRKCQAGTAECEHCGAEFVRTVPKRIKKAIYPRKFCSIECRNLALAEKSKYRYVTAQGYIRIQPLMSRDIHDGYVRLNLGAGRGGRVLEHRWMMEQALGRPLESSETVHHINGDKTDNRLDNLQLRSGKHGKGVALECLDCGSHNVQPVPLKGHSSIA
jgi:hypothetical protein